MATSLRSSSFWYSDMSVPLRAGSHWATLGGWILQVLIHGRYADCDDAAHAPSRPHQIAGLNPEEPMAAVARRASKSAGNNLGDRLERLKLLGAAAWTTCVQLWPP